MQLPTLLYGTYQQVAMRMKPLPKLIANGRTLAECLTDAGFYDTLSTHGLLILHGPSPQLGSSDNYHLFLPLDLIRKSRVKGVIPIQRESEIFMESLQSTWGVLFAIASQQMLWDDQSNRCRVFLGAVQQLWSDLADVGPRYSFGGT